MTQREEECMGWGAMAGAQALQETWLQILVPVPPV